MHATLMTAPFAQPAFQTTSPGRRRKPSTRLPAEALSALVLSQLSRWYLTMWSPGCFENRVTAHVSASRSSRVALGVLHTRAACMDVQIQTWWVILHS